jgi:hypothetical protein
MDHLRYIYIYIYIYIRLYEKCPYKSLREKLTGKTRSIKHCKYRRPYRKVKNSRCDFRRFRNVYLVARWYRLEVCDSGSS